MNLVKRGQEVLRRIVGNERTYNRLRRVLLLYQFYFKAPHEPDYLILKCLRGRKKGLFVDVGANGGQSAIAFASICPTFDIVSYEPNPSLWPELDFIKRVLGSRFSYHRTGLGKEAGRYRLHIPVQGRLPITTRASIDRELVDKQLDHFADQQGQPAGVKEVDIVIRRFDDLDIQPDVVKIDVEGHELSVLEGMTETIAKSRPVFLVEKNVEIDACQALLQAHGYRFYDFNVKTRALSTDKEDVSCNWFAIPAELVDEFLRN